MGSRSEEHASCSHPYLQRGNLGGVSREPKTDTLTTTMKSRIPGIEEQVATAGKSPPSHRRSDMNDDGKRDSGIAPSTRNSVIGSATVDPDAFTYSAAADSTLGKFQERGSVSVPGLEPSSSSLRSRSWFTLKGSKSRKTRSLERQTQSTAASQGTPLRLCGLSQR